MAGRRRTVVPLLLLLLGPACSAGVPDRPSPASPEQSAPRGEVVLAAGDIANCRREEDEATAALAASAPGTILVLGDAAYPDGSEEDFGRCFGAGWGALRPRVRPAPGNHEYHTAGAAGYFGYFRGAAGPQGRGYYSFDVGTWHLVSLNSNCDDAGGCDTDSPQGRWLARDLAEHPTACTLAFWHHPRFSSGARHGGSSRMAEAWEILARAGADLVLSGHEHHYERLGPLDAEGAVDPERGIRSFVVGTGGARLYPFGEPVPGSEVRDDRTHGLLRLDLGDGEYAWQFLPTPPGPFTDRGAARCR